jgi:hypothetical protein
MPNHRHQEHPHGGTAARPTRDRTQNGRSACALTLITHYQARPLRRLVSERLPIRIAIRAPRFAAASAARQSYAGVMIRPSSDGRRLIAHLEPGGPCIAMAERQPDGRWLVNGRAMSREHAGVALEAAVTVAAASRPPHGAAQAPAPLTEASAASSVIAPKIIP